MSPGKYIRKTFSIAFAALILFACSGPVGQLTPDHTLTTAITDTPESQGQMPCGYVQSTKPLPDVTGQVQAAFASAGIKEATVRAEAFGENCIDENGAVRSFSTMETDFHITQPVKDLSDRQALGNQLEKILGILDQFPVGKVPGPQPGYIGVGFTAGQDVLNLWFTVSAGKSAREQGLKGVELLSALENH